MLITFEGIDGCGKSTQVERLAEWMVQKQVPFARFREPGGTLLSEKLRDLLLDSRKEMDPVTELLLFSAARSELVARKVIPALERGEMVILDRFYDSTTAYQGYGRQVLDLDQIDSLNRLAAHGLVPDLTIYLKISPEKALERLDGQKDRMEASGMEFFDRVAGGFDRLSEGNRRFLTLDAALPVEEVHKRVVSEVERRMERS